MRRITGYSKHCSLSAPRIPLFISLILLLFTIFISSCSNKEDSVAVFFDSTEEQKPYVDELLSRHPLPEEIERAETRDNADWVISFITRAWDEEKKEEDYTYSQKRTVEHYWFAPVVHFSTHHGEAAYSEVSAGRYEVRPLDEISLPYRALPVDGTYPHETGYPLTAEKVARMHAPLEPVFNEQLQKWFDTIPIRDNTPTPPVWIAGAGDIMPGRGVDHILLTRADGVEYVFRDTLPSLRSADLLMGNLETAVTYGGDLLPKSYNFRVVPEVLAPLASAGFDYLSLTNNHCFDYGMQGFLDTLEALKQYGIHTSGAGTSLDDAAVPFRTSLNGSTFQVLSFGAYPREMNGFDGRRQAGATEEKAGILWAGETAFESMQTNFGDETYNIVLVHGGKEWSSTPTDKQMEIFRRCIDVGADLVIGSHPHVLQGMEVYRGKLIAYSLGNFIFPGMEETTYGEESLILRAGIVNGAVLYLEYIPVQIIRDHVTVDDTGTIVERFLSLTRSLE